MERDSSSGGLLEIIRTKNDNRFWGSSDYFVPGHPMGSDNLFVFICVHSWLPYLFWAMDDICPDDTHLIARVYQVRISNVA